MPQHGCGCAGRSTSHGGGRSGCRPPPAGPPVAAGGPRGGRARRPPPGQQQCASPGYVHATPPVPRVDVDAALCVLFANTFLFVIRGANTSRIYLYYRQHLLHYTAQHYTANTCWLFFLETGAFLHSQWGFIDQLPGLRQGCQAGGWSSLSASTASSKSVGRDGGRPRRGRGRREGPAGHEAPRVHGVAGPEPTGQAGY